MCQDMTANWVRRIPDTVKIVAHNIDKVNVVSSFEIKPSQIPVARRYCERDLICGRLFTNRISEFFKEDCELLPVVRVSASIRCSWVLLPVLLDFDVPAGYNDDYPVKIYAIESVFPKKTK